MSLDRNDEARAFARSLFHPAGSSAPEQEPDLSRGNVAPREGGTATAPQPDEMIPFIRSIFGRDIDG